MRLKHKSTYGPLPTSQFVLTDEHGFEVGVIQVRHRPSHRKELPPSFGNHVGYTVHEPFRRKGYGTRMLALAKDEARKIGLSEILLTCAPDNEASRKIIERNGGVLIDVEESVGDLLFSIKL